jgi:hypothetical protein
MKHYIIYNQQGKILQNISTNENPNSMLLFGNSILEVPQPLLDFESKKVQNGKIVDISAQENDFSYDFNRYLEYPAIREQLGALWHDIDQGLFGENAKQGKFYTTVLDVKNKFPKT